MPEPAPKVQGGTQGLQAQRELSRQTIAMTCNGKGDFHSDEAQLTECVRTRAASEGYKWQTDCSTAF
jgi:hypothetical protein